MSLVMIILSTLLLALLFAHSWSLRGRAITIGFFCSSFLFGIVRGNLIHVIITRVLGGGSLPYIFVKPVIRIWNVSLQECVGWTFIIYLSWSLAERFLWLHGGGRRDTVPVLRLLGLVCLIMGAASYAVEAVATGSQWWIWTIQVRNPYYAAVPWAGIVAWISVGFDFFWPFLLIATGASSKKPAGYLLLLLFPLHMLCHLKTTQISADWLPLLTEELWHWLMICTVLAGIVLGGPRVKIPLPGKAADAKGIRGFPVRLAVPVAALGFLLVLAACHLFLIGSCEMLISLVPLVAFLLFPWPRAAIAFCLAACVGYGLVQGHWTYTLAPAAFLAVLVYAAYVPVPAGIRSRGAARLLHVCLGVFLVLATVLVYRSYCERNLRYRPLIGLITRLNAGESAAGINSASLERLIVRPQRSKDAIPYNQLGYLLLQDRYPEAAFILEQAAACDSTFACAYLNLGLAYENTGRLEKAAAAYEKGLELNPLDTDSYLELGKIYERTNRPELAGQLYRRGLEYKPGHRQLALALRMLAHQKK
ncbi:MAG: tetratricopeptide repeat protein [Candidatus Glassbacteria bacterium]|nr:tetratricopeptide repeat protein [Candidatus Glassbacteria bacterium]